MLVGVGEGCGSRLGGAKELAEWVATVGCLAISNEVVAQVVVGEVRAAARAQPVEAVVGVGLGAVVSEPVEGIELYGVGGCSGGLGGEGAARRVGVSAVAVVE